MTTELRRLGPEHRDEISEFTCARYRQPWTEAVQDMVRNGLVYALENGVAEAVGLWSEQELVAISAWIVQDDATWRSVVLAVATGHSRRGYGGRLKRDLIERARSAGAQELISLVDRDNDPMMRLNEQLGAVSERDPDDPTRSTLIYRITL